MLQFIHELICLSSQTSGEARRLQIGNRANLISFRLIRHQSEIPPRTLLLGAFGFAFFVPVLVCETAFHKTRETISFNHGYQVEVEIPPVLGGRLAVQRKRSFESDLLLHQVHDCLVVDRTTVLLFDCLRHEGNRFFRGYPGVRKQVFEHADGVANDQTLPARNRTDGPVLR